MSKTRIIKPTFQIH